MNVLITGGLGFIGLALAKNLIKLGHTVRLLDCNSIQYRGKELFTHESRNMYSLQFEDGKWVEGELFLEDIRNIDACMKSCQGIDVVIHSAAIHSASQISANPIHSTHINIQGTINILQAAQKNGASRFIYLSSGKVYGEPVRIPSREDDYSVPLESYALTKTVGEYYCHLFHEQHELETVCIRPFSVYGPGQSLNSGYVGMMIKALRNDGKYRMPGMAEYLRDFIYIDDVVDICVRAIFKKGLENEIFNAGAGVVISLIDLVQCMEKISGKPLYPVFEVPSSITLKQMLADMDKVKTVLGFSPQVMLEEGLQKTINWFGNNQS